MRKLIVFLTFFAVSVSCELAAQQLVYRPVNPAFGGETFNYNWLLSSATAQNLIEDTRPDDDDPFGLNTNPLENFEANLNQQILNQLSRQLVDDQFGEGGIQDGNYDIGGLNIDITTSVQGVIITIFDPTVGEQTQLLVPFF